MKSKAGLLHALMHDAIFGPRFKLAQQKLEGVKDPVRRLALSAHVARAIYEGESAELSLLMKSSAFSPELRKTQQSFETLRRDMQRERIDALFAARRARMGTHEGNGCNAAMDVHKPRGVSQARARIGLGAGGVSSLVGADLDRNSDGWLGPGV